MEEKSLSSTPINKINNTNKTFTTNKNYKPIRSDSCKQMPTHYNLNNKRPSMVESLSFYMKNTSLDQSSTTSYNTNSTTTSPRTTRKNMIHTWKIACDKTKDKTRELIKKWKNTEMTGGSTIENEQNKSNSNITDNNSNGNNNNDNNSNHEKTWSVHVWATWVKRCPSDEESPEKNQMSLSQIQQEKLNYFFEQLLDQDHDELISSNDFHNLAERIRRFADWSENSGEYFIVEQIRYGFINTFITSKKEDENLVLDIEKIYIDQEHWLNKWNQLIKDSNTLNSFPIWIQYFPRILFQAINKSGSGNISKEELRQYLFYIVGLDSKCVDKELENIYLVLTANGDKKLDFYMFQLSFINFLLGKHPNGPGQYLFGLCSHFPDTFPVDYSALNAEVGTIEHYSPSRKSIRSSVIV